MLTKFGKNLKLFAKDIHKRTRLFSFVAHPVCEQIIQASVSLSPASDLQIYLVFFLLLHLLLYVPRSDEVSFCSNAFQMLQSYPCHPSQMSMSRSLAGIQ